MPGLISRMYSTLTSNRTRTLVGALIIVATLTLALVSISISLPDTEIRVTSFEPNGWTVAATNLTVKFSKAMVSKDSLDKPVLNPPLVFSPPLRGLARWVETDVLRFFPDGELLPATEYTVNVTSDKTWASGLKLADKQSFKFWTSYLTVTSAEASTDEYEAEPGKIRISINLIFNYDVNLDDLRSRVTFKGEKGATKKELQFTLTPLDNQGESIRVDSVTGRGQAVYASRFVVVSEPIEIVALRQSFTMLIDKGVTCRSCGLPLKDQYSQTINIDQKVAVAVTEAMARSAADGGAIYIYFTGQISADAVASYVTVSPASEYSVETSWSSLVIRGNFRPGNTVEVKIAKGMPAIGMNSLAFDYSNRLQFPDLEPSVQFSSRGIFLPKAGNGLMEVKTTNIPSVAVEVEQVFQNNLVYFLTSGYGDDVYGYSQGGTLGRKLLVKDMELASKQNEPLATTIDLASFVGDSAKGIFKISVRSKNERWIADSRYAMITDIGLSARLSDNYLMVWANSLTGTTPLAGVTISLVSKNNQTLVEGKTDSRGIAIIEKIKDKLNGFEPFVIIAKNGSDMAYLRLDETLLPISDFDVSGRPYLTTGYESFIYTDRGVYRPGDTAHIVSIVRAPEGTVPPSFPYFLTIYDSRGRKFTSFRVTTDNGALATVDFAVPDYAGTGKYGVMAEIGENLQIGLGSFQVEDFMPDRIKVTLSTDAKSYRTGQTIKAGVDAKYLFGPPASGARVTGHLSIEPYNFTPSGWSQYTFTNPDRSFSRMEVDLKDSVTNDTGGFSYSYVIPKTLVAPSALKGLLATVVSEQGGRGVADFNEILIHPYERYIGTRLGFDGYAKPGEAVRIMLVGVSTDGKAVSVPKCAVRFNRIVYNTVLRKDKTGIYRYMSERRTVPLDSTSIALAPEGGAVSFTPGDYGSYQVVASDPDGGHSSAVEFYASGWGYAPWAMTTPDRIELQFDKARYAVGDKAKLQVRAPFGGKLLLTVEKGTVIETMTRDMADNTAEIEIPVKKEYFPNSYVMAAVVRPSDSLEPNMPARAFGMVPIQLSTDEKKLGITVSTAPVVKPKSEISVDLQVNRGKGTQITVAAVDAGILQLTDFKTPDPLDFFWGKKAPSLKPYDLYSFLYPHVNQATSHLKAGGDKMFAAGRLRHLNPINTRRVRPVALWSSVLTTDKDGKAQVSFTLPEFNGKLVVMAVGAQNDLFGSATSEITVRDKIVIQESFPRFVSPNDQFDGLVTVFNNTGAQADITLTATAEGPVEFVGSNSTMLTLDNNRQGNASFRIKAKSAPGKVKFAINARSGDEQSQITIELPNRPAVPLVTKSGSGVITADAKGSITLPSDWLAGTDEYAVKLSGFPVTRLAKNLQYLLGYPYGCVEQTTSRLFPMLYYNNLARVINPALFGGKGSDYYIQEGILKLNSMLLPDGSFSYWPGGTTANNWATVYASHFLSEASRAGYYVDKKLLDKMYDHLEDMANGRKVGELTDAHRIYAAYVLGQAGKLNQRTVSYLKQVDPSKLDPYTKYQLAGALAYSGNNAEALRLLPVEIQPNLFEPETGGCFNSGVRTDAILLDILQQVTPNSPSVAALAKSLMDRAEISQWYTTQENAFGLMALGKYFKSQSTGPFVGSMQVTGEQAIRFDTSGYSVTRKDLGNKKIDLALTSGTGPCFYYWQASGIPLSNTAPEFDKGLAVRRKYLSQNGTPIDPTKVKLGDQIVAVISVSGADKALYNVVVNDLLPSGFEIENPRLKTSPRLSWVPAQSADIDFQDIRDDRLLIFATIYPQQTLNYYYSVRAISAGAFKIPPITAECMYNPLITSSSSSGNLTIAR